MIIGGVFSRLDLIEEGALISLHLTAGAVVIDRRVATFYAFRSVLASDTSSEARMRLSSAEVTAEGSCRVQYDVITMMIMEVTRRYAGFAVDSIHLRSAVNHGERKCSKNTTAPLASGTTIQSRTVVFAR